MANRGLRRSISDFRRHPWLHLISISTITVALVILGGFFLCYRNFDSLAERTSPQITGTVYLKDAVSDLQVSILKTRLTHLENVAAVTFKSKGSVVAELQSFLGGSGLEAMPGTDLFPDVIELTIRPETGPAKLAELKATIAKASEVAEVDFSEDWLSQYKKIRQFLRILGILLFAAVVIGCSFIIANFMGMRHQSRKNEIDIVRLIGAEQNFVLAPFLWEGLFEGIIGSSVALVVLYVTKALLSAVVTVQWTSLLGLREWLFLTPLQGLGLMAMGIVMAFCGSFTVFLRFQENSP